MPSICDGHLECTRQPQRGTVGRCDADAGATYGTRTATQLLKAGVHPKVVSERLGHASIGITLDTYSHVLPSMQEEAAEKIDAGLRKALAR
jgi:integrase